MDVYKCLHPVDPPLAYSPSVQQMDPVVRLHHKCEHDEVTQDAVQFILLFRQTILLIRSGIHR